MIPDLPRFNGVPDRFIAAINERLRALVLGTGTASRSHRGTGPSVPPSGGTTTLRVALAGSTGQVGVFFNASLVASDGTAPYTYLIAAGSLPPGLALNGLTGAITGTPTTAGQYSFTASVTDADSNTATASCSINIALPSGASTLIDIVSATGRDMGHSTDVGNTFSRLVMFSVGVLLTFLSVPTQYVTLYLSKDNGVTWVWAGWFLYLLNGQESNFPVLRPIAIGTWKVAAVPGTINGDPAAFLATASLPSGRVISSGFSVAALTLPSATLGTAPTPATGAGGSWPYNKTTADGSQYWSISALNVDLSAAFLDANVFVINSTFQDLDSSHNPIGPEKTYGGVVPVNGVVNIGQLDGDYGTDGFGYVRTGNIAYVRWKLRASNQVDQTTAAWLNPAASTLQTDPGTGAGYVDILVAAGGTPPPGKVLNFGGSLQQDPSTTNHGSRPGHGTTVVTNQNSGASVIADASFNFSTAGTLGIDGAAPGWNWGLGPSATVVIKDDGGNSDTKYARLGGGDASISQRISVQAGLRFYAQVAARSSNTGGAAHAIGLYVDWLSSSLAPLTPYTTVIGTVSGYVAAWTNPSISGYLTAPTGAAFAIVKVATAMAEPGYWDVDDVLVQPVINQTAAGTTASTGQSVTGAGTSVFTAQAAAAGATYGMDHTLITNSLPDSLTLTPRSVILSHLLGGGGYGLIQVVNSDGSKSIALQVTDAGAPAIGVTIGGVGYVGLNGTIQDNFGVNHTVKCGLIVS